MKKRNFLWMSAAFVSGSVFGIALLGLVSFSGPSAPPAGPAINKIDTTIAKTYYQNYLKNAAGTVKVGTTVIKGLFIDKEDITAMNTLMGDVPSLAGVRAYLGIDGSGNKVVLMIASDASGNDIKSSTVYSVTRTSNVGPCPPICDVRSPITR